MIKLWGMKKIFKYFSLFEWLLWVGSIITVVVFFIVLQNKERLYLVTTITGVTSLIFLAKGNAVGLILSTIFSIFYVIVAITFRYYSEVITYAFMTLPISVISFIQWIKNPFKGNKSEVEIAVLKKETYFYIIVAGATISMFFYFILVWFNTPNLIFSVVSIFTSFVAAYLSLKRSPFYALAYALNDIILIVLWILATIDDLSYLAIVICFVSFLINDLYGFYNWNKMLKRQAKEKTHD
jgi:nicotinamide mononucleotide transporter PnuC